VEFDWIKKYNISWILPDTKTGKSQAKKLRNAGLSNRVMPELTKNKSCGPDPSPRCSGSRFHLLTAH
jgi:hypothetical protein